LLASNVSFLGCETSLQLLFIQKVVMDVLEEMSLLYVRCFYMCKLLIFQELIQMQLSVLPKLCQATCFTVCHKWQAKCHIIATHSCLVVRAMGQMCTIPTL
jgi:hypothetical protein